MQGRGFMIKMKKYYDFLVFHMIFIISLCILGAYGFKETPENQYFILSTSKFWFNMRQSVNSLMLY